MFQNLTICIDSGFCRINNIGYYNNKQFVFFSLLTNTVILIQLTQLVILIFQRVESVCVYCRKLDEKKNMLCCMSCDVKYCKSGCRNDTNYQWLFNKRCRSKHHWHYSCYLIQSKFIKTEILKHIILCPNCKQYKFKFYSSLIFEFSPLMFNFQQIKHFSIVDL